MKKLLISIVCVLCLSSSVFAIPIFPGAEGFGTESNEGVRGFTGTPTVVKVTNLNDSGPGSFREAVAGTGKDGRVVVFEVSGNINLTSGSCYILSNYITIAGETSPEGICIVGDEVGIGSADTYPIHDVLIRHLRFRTGTSNCAPACDEEHALIIWKSYDITIDHCSFSWGIDEVVSVTTFNNAPAYNITFSNCIFAEGLTDAAPENNHGYLFLFNGTYVSGNSMSMHHNFFVSGNARLPQFSGEGLFDFRNNVVHNWDSSQNTMIIPYVAQIMNINFVSNYAKVGNDSNACSGGRFSSFNVQAQSGGGTDQCPDTNPALTPYETMYMSDNGGCRRPTGTEDEWQFACGWSGVTMDLAWQRLTPFLTPNGDVTTTPMTELYSEQVVANAGANKCQTGDCSDSQDQINIAQYTNGTASLVADMAYPTGYPTFGSTEALTDTDGDGMPDSWESANGTNPAVADAFGDVNLNGYFNIEDYFHSLTGDTPSTAPNVTMPSNFGTSTTPTSYIASVEMSAGRTPQSGTSSLGGTVAFGTPTGLVYPVNVTNVPLVSGANIETLTVFDESENGNGNVTITYIPPVTGGAIMTGSFSTGAIHN